MRMIIVTGLSGSGKSIALQTLEDLGYYCVDNLPLELLKPFADTLQARMNRALATTVVGIDARNFLDELVNLPGVIAELNTLGWQVEILFLQADDEVLLKRYSETRRKHPLSLHGMPLQEAIQRERTLLESIMAYSTQVVDTNTTNVHELRQLLRKRFGEKSSETLSLLFESFGFKYGVPADADFVFDVRCLPNPYWDRQLRELSGQDTAVVNFLAQQPKTVRMVSDIEAFLSYWIPCFEADDRSYVTVAIGCTGGRHRSVYIAAQLAERFARHRTHVTTRHRELS